MDYVGLKAQYREIGRRIDDALAGVLERAHFIQGPEVGELERRLAEFAGVQHCISCANGTDALLVAQMLYGVRPGDEVVMPGFSYIAAAETTALLGARPVYVDIDPDTYNINPDCIEAAITGRTKVIVAVSLFGQCADLDPVVDVARRHGLPVIEDAAQSFGARYYGRRSCSLTDVACTSFFPTKPLGCYGDGGAIFTDDEELALRARQICQHGQDRRYHHIRVGINSRLDTLQAAILLEKLAVFERETELRRTVAGHYDRLLEGVEGIRTPHVAPYCESVYAQYTVRVDDRVQALQRLQDAGIPAAIHYPLPLNKQPAVADLHARLPHGDLAAQQVLSLPMHPYLPLAEQERIVRVLAT